MTRLSLNHINQNRLWAIWAFILLLGLPLIANAQSNIAYRPSLGAASPALDVYTTAKLKNAPVIIYVHGGAWKIGDKKRVHAKPTHFNDLGFVFVSINYRLVPKVTVENQLKDVDQALRWVARNIAKYGGNPDNLHLLGHSAGAHLVTMTGVRPLANAKVLIAKGALRSVMSNDTRAYDLPRIAAGSRGGNMPKLYVDAFGKDAVRWQALSPLYQLKPGRKLPAFLILYSGQGDNAVRRSFATDFAGAVQEFGGSATLFDGSKYSHARINKEMGRNNDITDAVDRFLQKQIN